MELKCFIVENCKAINMFINLYIKLIKVAEF